jgi:Inorganic Pyrophosphatase
MLRNDLPFDQWRQLQKAPSRGGAQSPISPGFGMMGPGNTNSAAAAGRASRRSGQQGLPAPISNSKYTQNPPLQPDPWIDDVDMAENWYSPFQPVWPFGPPGITRPREWDYPVGYNLNYIQPRMELMGMLRALRGGWGVLATIIATRQDQLLRIPWTIQRRDKPRQTSKAVDEMRKFFRRPDGKLSYSQWTRLITDDLLVLDAPCIYFSRDRAGRPLTAERLDPITVFPLIDDAGRRPDSIVEVGDDGITYLRRQPAFQQIIKGLPMIDLDESELMYVPMRPRADLPMFGYPATEQILIEATAMIRKTLYQFNFWAEGTIPDLIVNVPPGWTPRQIAMFQAHFDAMLSGNLTLKSKVRFLPGDMKPFEVKNSSGESLYGQWDETMIRLACYAYSVSPAPFIKQMNRSTAQNAQQMAEAEGLYPLMMFWKDDIIDPIIQERFGYDDVEFVFLPRPEPDAEKQAKIHQVQLDAGMRPVNEVREEIGLEPIPGGDVAIVHAGNLLVPLESAARGQAATAMGPATPPGPSGGDEARNPGPRAASNPKPNSTPQRGAARPNEASPLPRPTPAVNKASKSEVRAASREATGGIDNYSHLVLHTGNYKKGHVWIQGLNVSIENKKGSKRGEKDQHGKKWQVKMPAPYGYIRGTIGADGMQVDVYLGKHPNSPTVWVIDQWQVDSAGNQVKFDEHKVMLGYKKLKSAVRDWMKSHFGDHGYDTIRDIVELSVKDFKSWLKDGDLHKPIADQDVGEVVLRQKDLKKGLDSISAATNLAWYSQGTGSPKPQKRKRRKATSGPRWLQLTA